MSGSEFNILLLNNTALYFYSLLMYFVPIFLLFRKEVDSILDPFLFLLVGAYFAHSVALFLFLTGTVSSTIYLYCLISELAFLLGLKSFKKVKLHSLNSPQISNEHLYISILQNIAFIIFFLAQTYVYAKKGIPIFSEERLALFRSESGFGIFDRIIDASSYIVMFSSFYFVVKNKAIPRALFQLGIITLSLLLSGSKASFLTVIFVYFICLTYEQQKLKTNKLVIVLVLFIPVIINMISLRVDIATSALYTIFRFIKFGDIFYIALPHDNYKFVALETNGLIMLFSDFLGMFRILPWKFFGQPIGFQLFNIAHPSNELLMGPNVRHNIFGLIFFGKYLGVLFSFALGTFISYFRKKFFISYSRSFTFKLILGFVLLKVYAINTDPIYGLSRLNNVIFAFLIIGIAQFLFFIMLSKNEKNPSHI